MTTDNVTPIRGGNTPPSEPKKPPRERRKKARGLVLLDGDEYDGFDTVDVVHGLYGVCLALDVKGEDRDIDAACLAAAARVLSSILRNRVE